MKDPKRIKRILQLIGVLWNDYHDLRLLQLLGNALPRGDHYYIEDDELEKLLKETYKHCLKKESG